MLDPPKYETYLLRDRREAALKDFMNYLILKRFSLIGVLILTLAAPALAQQGLGVRQPLEQGPRGTLLKGIQYGRGGDQAGQQKEAPIGIRRNQPREDGYIGLRQRNQSGEGEAGRERTIKTDEEGNPIYPPVDDDEARKVANWAPLSPVVAALEEQGYLILEIRNSGESWRAVVYDRLEQARKIMRLDPNALKDDVKRELIQDSYRQGNLR